MFRKLVSNIAFSPALVGQLGFYARRLRQEELTRRVGLVFTALALVVQSFAVFNPPESANASSANDFVPGGVSTMGRYLQHYDANTHNIRDFYNAVGITRAELKAAGNNKTTIHSKSGVLSYGFRKHFSTGSGEHHYNFPLASGGNGRAYYRPLSLWDSRSSGSTYTAWIGHSAKVGWFAIMANCGNFVTKTTPPAPPCPPGTTGRYPNCVAPKCPIPGKTHLPPNHPDCAQPVAACQSLSIASNGPTYSLNGRSVAAKGATIQSYTYTVKKDGKVVKTITNKSTQPSNAAQYAADGPGAYTVTLSVATSLGTKSGTQCTKAFTVAPPEKCPLNPALEKDDPLCQPCPGDDTIWLKDEKCEAKIVETKSAVNVTQEGVDAVTATARAADKILYTVTVENIGNEATTVSIDEQITDVLEYAKLIENGGGTYNEESGVLSWKDIKVEPGQKQSRQFMVQLTDSISALGQGKSNRTSYDCKMTNTFGNTVEIGVDCPTPKEVEAVVEELPQTGATENMMFAGIVLAVVVYFYARSRQLNKEVRLIRRDLNAGTI